MSDILDPQLGTDIVRVQNGTETPAVLGVSHLIPQPGLCSIIRRPVFQVGHWNGEDWDQSVVESVLEAFNATVKFVHPWITVNHKPPEDAAALTSNEPLVKLETPKGLCAFMGFVSRLYLNEKPYITSDGRTIPPGELVMADWVNVAPRLAQAIKRRNFLRASVGLLPNQEVNGQIWPWLLEHISVEGEWEAVHTLEDLDRWYYCASDASGQRKTITFSKGAITMAMTADELAPRVDSLEQGQRQLMDGQQTISATLQSVVTKLDALAGSKPPEQPPQSDMAKKPEQPPQQMENATAAPVAAPGAADGNPAQPSAAPAAAPADSTQAIVDQVTKQFKAKLDDQERRIQAITRKNEEDLKVAKSKERKLFLAQHRDKIQPLQLPVAEYILEEADALEDKSVRKFARVKADGTHEDIGLASAIRLFMSGGSALLMSGPQLANLDAPAGDLHAPRWDRKSTQDATHAYAKKNNVPITAAFQALAKEHGPDFERAAR